MFSRMLVPVDGSRHARRAVGAAVEIAKRYGSSVYLLHAIRNLSLPREILAMIAAGEVTQSRMEILEDSADIILDSARERFEKAGIEDVQSKYLIGDPAWKIAEYAKEKKVDLIVIGHRGLGPGGELLGSVTRKLLNLTEIACLIVP